MSKIKKQIENKNIEIGKISTALCGIMFSPIILINNPLFEEKPKENERKK